MTVLKPLAATLALCLSSTLAAAQPIPAQEMLKQHCTGDYLAHCGDFAPGGPEVEACFRRKIKQLSPNCAASIATYQQEQSRIRRVSAAR